MKPSNLSEPLISLSDAARLTNESLAVWRKRVFHRQIDFVKCGRNVRLLRSSLETWIAGLEPETCLWPPGSGVSHRPQE